eukprot:jgi/Antlo1/2172/255
MGINLHKSKIENVCVHCLSVQNIWSAAHNIGMYAHSR